MSRPIVLSIHFHSGKNNSFTSNDYRFNLDYNNFIYIKSFIKHMRMNSFANIKLSGYYSDDKVFVITGDAELCDTKLIKEHIEGINGEYLNTNKAQAYARELINEYWKRYNLKRTLNRKSLGYVNCDFDILYKPLNSLRGNLPLSIIIDNLDYLGSGCVGGYFGHSNRMLWMDDVIK